MIYNVNYLPCNPILIGFPGENESRPISIDVSPWLAEFPQGVVSFDYERADKLTYPVVVNQTGNVVTWEPLRADLVKGIGALQIRLKQDDIVKKSCIVSCKVGESLDDPSDPPAEPRPTYVEEVLDAANRAEAAVSHYPQIVNGVWYVWNAETGKFVSTGISAQGEDGISPTVTVTAIEGGHRVTITDAAGAHPFDVMDGEDGEGGGTTANAVLYTPQTLTPAQQEQARLNIGAGTYSKPSGGIPASDLAAGVIPDISGKANSADVAALVSRLNAIADSDDTTLDQLSEIVAYIKSNRTLIDNITTGKVSVSDIVDNLTSTATGKPLSANQGRVLKALIDSIVVPTESTVSGWGFTKNTGTYSKPNGGIPKTDLAQAVQTSLGKADTALQSHQSLAAYRTASAQDTIDEAQDTSIAAKYTKPSGGIPTGDLNLIDLGTWLGNAGATIYTLALSGSTATLNNSFLTVLSSLTDSARQTLFVLPIGGTAQQPIAFEMYLVHMDAQTYSITLGTEYNGNRYSVTLSAASATTSPMTGTLVTEPIVTQSDIPTAVSELTNDSGYQTASDVQTAISGVRQLPAGGSVGDFLRKDCNGNAAWETIQTYQGGSY